MFKYGDIVGVGTRARGIVRKCNLQTGHVIIQFGADGPTRRVAKSTVRWVCDKFLEQNGGRNFFKVKGPKADYS